MPINKKFNIIFFHVPKTAGTSIEKILDMSYKKNFYTAFGPSDRKNSLQIEDFCEREKINLTNLTLEEKKLCLYKNMQHFTVKELKKILDPSFFNSAYKFSVVRNPYHRIVSEYFHMCKICSYFSEFNGFLLQNFDFKEFVKNELSLPVEQRILKYDGHLEPQSYFLLDENSSLSYLNKIYKMETDIQECLQFCGQVANINTNNIHARNGDYDKNYSQYYDDFTKNLVYNFYKEDFDLFGYSINI